MARSRVLTFLLHATKPYRWYLGGMFISVCMIAADASIKPYLIKLLIDGVTTSMTWLNLLPLLGLYACMQSMHVLAYAIGDLCLARFMAPFQCYSNDIFIERLNSYAYSFFQNHPSGSLYTKMHDVFAHTHDMIYNILHQCCYFGIMVLVAAIFLFNIHPAFAGALCLWIIIFSIIARYGVTVGLPLSCAQEKSRIGGHLVDYLVNILNVRCFVTWQHEEERLKKLSNDYIQGSKKQIRFWRNYYTFKGTVVSFYIMGFIVGLMYLRLHGMITPGDCAMVFMINFSVINKCYELSFHLRSVVKHWGIIDQALQLLELPIDIKDKPDAQPLVVKDARIVFDKVQFNYHGCATLFRDKSLVIEPGQKIGLVGYSGSGKTTFAHLILRLFDVTGGSIAIDGQDIRSVTQDTLRLMIGMIPQDPSLFHRTIMENIRYGRINASDHEVMEAAQQAHAHEFIVSLAQGYHALVGERGVKLSGGQRQRIAIARAILKNAPILILDEATSQLDSVVEGLIQESLWKLMQQKTTIVIAHRLSTLLRMDRILVFQQGHIVEDGTHAQLLTQAGSYKKLWDAQVGGFLPE